jgi:hypothetical protein
MLTMKLLTSIRTYYLKRSLIATMSIKRLI